MRTLIFFLLLSLSGCATVLDVADDVLDKIRTINNEVTSIVVDGLDGVRDTVAETTNVEDASETE